MDDSEVFQKKILALNNAVKAVRCYKDDTNPSLIEEGLYLGAYGAAMNKTLLKQLNVTHVLTVAKSIPPPYPQDFTYKVIEVFDNESTNLEQYFDDSINFIDEAKKQGGAVLVHCVVGKSRSATIVTAYLIKRHGMSSADALQFVKSRRPVADPNTGFVSQLHNFSRSLELQGLFAANRIQH